MNRIPQRIRARRSCHSCVINCPVELGRDSNWIDYRYAPGKGERVERVDGDGGDGGVGDSFDFRLDRSGEPKAWLKNIPRPIITAGFCNYIYPENVRPEIYSRESHSHTYIYICVHDGRGVNVPLFPAAILYDHFIYLLIINARNGRKLVWKTHELCAIFSHHARQ